jgi:hypothetical protein
MKRIEALLQRVVRLGYPQQISIIARRLAISWLLSSNSCQAIENELFITH